MIFWIILAVTVLVILGSFFWDVDESPVLTVFAILVVFGVAALGVLFAQALLGDRTTTVQQYQLNALVSQTRQEGAYFFLGTGVAEETPVYTYVEVSGDGGIRIKQAPIRSSVIYETAEQPRMELVRAYGDSWWIAPWPVEAVGNAVEYRFFIPPGSVFEGYEVTP